PAGPCFIRTGRPAAGPDNDRRRCRFVRIQHRYPDETAPCRIAAWTPPRLDRPYETRPSRNGDWDGASQLPPEAAAKWDRASRFVVLASPHAGLQSAAVR